MRLSFSDEDEAFRAVEKIIVPMWKQATAKGERRFWHEYFYELIQSIDPKLHQGRADQNDRKARKETHTAHMAHSLRRERCSKGGVELAPESGGGKGGEDGRGR